MKSSYFPIVFFLVMVFGAEHLATQQVQIRRAAPARPQEKPLPAGQDIYARDGDRVIIEDNARVRIITRWTGTIRVVYNADQRWLIVMIDSTSPESGTPDGKPDATFTFSGLEGDWPMDNRWDGYGGVEQYNQTGTFRPGGAGLITPIGLIQLLPAASPFPESQTTNLYRDPSARSVLTHRGWGSGNGGSATFDQMEQGLVMTASRNAQSQPGSVIRGVGGTVSVPGTANTVTGMPARVGGNIGVPRKIVDVAPIYPEAARRANITAVVILEVTVGTDGSVSNARVLRSVPLLDDAALGAVRQWRYEPAVVNGQAVPVVLTVTVPFSPQ